MKKELNKNILNRKLSEALSLAGPIKPGWEIYQVRFLYIGDTEGSGSAPELCANEVGILMTRMGEYVIFGDPRRFPPQCSVKEYGKIPRQEAIELLGWCLVHSEYEILGVHTRGRLDDSPRLLGSEPAQLKLAA